MRAEDVPVVSDLLKTLDDLNRAERVDICSAGSVITMSPNFKSIPVEVHTLTNEFVQHLRQYYATELQNHGVTELPTPTTFLEIPTE